MKGILTRVEQKMEDWCGRQKAVIYLFIRGEDGKRYVFKDPKFEPYCYFQRNILNVDSFPEIRNHQIVKIEGREYLKVWTKLPMHIGKLRRIMDKKFANKPWVVHTFEADVLFPLRYIIDHKIRGPVEWFKPGERPLPIDEDIPSNLRILIVDIEKLNNTIKCCTIWDSYEKKYYTFYWDEKEIWMAVIAGKVHDDDWILQQYPSEEEMLKAIFAFIKEKDPDVITGFNVDFDMVNLRNRAIDLRLGKEWDSVSPLDYPIPPPRVRKKKFRDFYVHDLSQKVPGRNVADLLEILLKMEKHQLSEFSLDYVAKNYLNPPMEKLTWNGMKTGPNVHIIWPQDPLHVLRYNKHDVEICVELNKQQQLIAFADELRKFVGCQVDEIFFNKRIAHVELLRKTKKPLPVTRKEEKPYKGAIVIPPQKGVHQWILVMDFRSLYPSIIIQLNVDPNTYIPEKQRRWVNYPVFILQDPEDKKKKYYFRQSPEGDLPAILKTYIKKRDEKRQQMREAKDRGDKALAEVYDVQQTALKVIANAFYGSLLYRGSPSGYQCAKAITCCARMAILFAKEVIEKLGYKVIYGDTDSIMIQSKFSSYKKCVEEADYLRQAVAKELPNFLSQFGSHQKIYLSLALDKIFSSFLIAEKKKQYAGIIETETGEGPLEIKGFGTVRSDTSAFSSKLQKVLIKEVLRGRAGDEIKSIVEEELLHFDKKELDEISVPCVITRDPEKTEAQGGYKKNPIQKKAYKFTKKYLNVELPIGGKPKRIYVKMIEEKKTPDVVDEVDVVGFKEDVPLSLPDWLVIDWPKNVEKTVKPKVEKVLQFVGLEWKDIWLKENLRKVKKERKKKTNVKSVSKAHSKRK